MAKETEEKPDTIAQLKRYEWADVAVAMAEDKGRMPYSLAAMKELYGGFGLDKDDAIINRAFAEARAGMKSGHITDSGVLEAMGNYAQRFAQTFKDSTVADFLAYVKERGYEDIPEKLKAAFEKYKTKTVKEIEAEIKKAQEERKNPDEDALRVYQALAVLRQQVREGELYGKLVRVTTKNSLERLVAEQPKEE
jgi:hypothetical protein